MTAPLLHCVQIDERLKPNAFGEVPLPYAPMVTLADGRRAVPQQYIDVVRTQENIEKVLACIKLPKHFQLFAGQEGSVLFLIVAIVGEENYPSANTPRGQQKIVYGRRWLIEQTTPTSEIVQTALLAVKKVREHELREKIVVALERGSDLSSVKTTPFNNHHDLPLLAGNFDSLLTDTTLSIKEQCELIQVDGLSLSLLGQTVIGEQTIAELKLTGQSDQFDDLSKRPFVVVVKHTAQFAHALAQTLINLSDRYIEEQFFFNDCPRFSRQVSPFRLAEFSYQTRNIESQDLRFTTAFNDMSYRVDAAKAPFISSGCLGDQQRDFLAQYQHLGGYLPKD